MRKRAPRQDTPDPDPVSPDLLAWAQVVDASRLSSQTADQAEDYLRRFRRLHPVARKEFGFRLVSVITSQVSPPPPAAVAPRDIIATVVAARRRQLGLG